MGRESMVPCSSQFFYIFGEKGEVEWMSLGGGMVRKLC